MLSLGDWPRPGKFISLNTQNARSRRNIHQDTVVVVSPPMRTGYLHDKDCTSKCEAQKLQSEETLSNRLVICSYFHLFRVAFGSHSSCQLAFAVLYIRPTVPSFGGLSERLHLKFCYQSFHSSLLAPPLSLAADDFGTNTRSLPWRCPFSC
ncbi:hypothetical protein BO71DRAFT_205328 [Aspergillus ellipticus CBS 707.79]|uniref:Uncharacterized protein n=1 Tax=Aspergillus ellipticus CBS 707.79 TaxID=1448320 RepID=A0A319DVD3_9EURO|nr:hypothetical protein BO71DRAFT_205328 [Aspergillus ellipticus CBS 707.79]